MVKEPSLEKKAAPKGLRSARKNKTILPAFATAVVVGNARESKLVLRIKQISKKLLVYPEEYLRLKFMNSMVLDYFFLFINNIGETQIVNNKLPHFSLLF